VQTTATGNGFKRDRLFPRETIFNLLPCKKKPSPLLLTLFTSPAFVFGATDIPETRRHEADRYLQTTAPKALFEDMADKIAVNLPPEQRQKFKPVMHRRSRPSGPNQSDDRRDGKKLHH